MQNNANREPPAQYPSAAVIRMMIGQGTASSTSRNQPSGHWKNQVIARNAARKWPVNHAIAVEIASATGTSDWAGAAKSKPIAWSASTRTATVSANVHSNPSVSGAAGAALVSATAAVAAISAMISRRA